MIEHIVNYAEKTQIVQKQLANPDFNVVSGKRFDEKTNNFDFAFEDLVAVDNNKLQSAFKVNIDQSAVNQTVTDYMKSIAGSISVNTDELRTQFDENFDALAAGLKVALPTPIPDPDDETKTIPGFTAAEIDAIVDNYLAAQEINEYFKTAYAGLLKATLNAYILAFPTIPDHSTCYDLAVTSIKSSAAYETAAKTLVEAIAEGKMQQEIIAKVQNLTNYLSDTFANSLSVDPEAVTGAFSLNFSEDELARVVASMFNKTETTQKTNLISFGYQDLESPTMIQFYFTSFDSKENFLKFVDNYNELMEQTNQDQKVIEYTDATGTLMSSVKTIVDAVSYVLIAFVSISLIVSSIMIGIITYISVYERTKEIGILRAIGASKHNISNIFNAETFIIGFLSGIFGIGISYLLIPAINAILHHFTGDIPLSAYLDPTSAFILIGISIVLTLIGGLIPAKKASKKDPVEALRTD